MEPRLDRDRPRGVDPARDHALDRLMLLTDGVYAIALTLLALDLRLPAEAVNLSGPDLLASLVGLWPRILSYVTSFTVVAMFWSVSHRMFHFIYRFDGGLRWLTLLQLGLVAFIPFPSAVLGEHLNDVVAEEFYFGTLTLTLFVSGAGWWYASWDHRLIAADLGEHLIRHYRLLSVASLGAFLAMMVLIPLGMGRIINPLVLGYVVAFVIILLGLLDREGPAHDAPPTPLSDREPTG